jgi:D-3-phosphoglycerate dehydrogenase / 2-oxoglutarate reductase
MDTLNILVADKLSPVGLDWLAAQPGITVSNQPGLSPEELGAVIGEFDGMIIRSGAKVTASVLEHAGRLRGIARAGVGVDNIDVVAATERGILVMNTPDGNTVSTAELALTLMLAMSRKIAPASASLLAGKWDRKPFQGTQLFGKTLGVVGMGRIGRAVALRAAGLGMKVLAFDPHVSFQTDADGLHAVTQLDELCREADYITVHVPRTPETAGMIGAEQMAMMKPSAHLINAARGGVIDEGALADALEAGTVAGAALDVYTAEPPTSDVHRRLIEHPEVLAVPHLGASTQEAQELVAVEAAQELVAALRGEEVRNALNAPGFDGEISELLEPYLALARRMGLMLCGMTGEAIEGVDIVYRGEIANMNVMPVTTHLLVGLLQNAVDEPVNVVNAPVLAQQRGVGVQVTTAQRSSTYANMLEVKVRSAGATRTISGTVFGRSLLRIVELDGFRVELEPVGEVAVFFNADTPGVIGQYGKVLGEAGINIAHMTVARKAGDGAAVALNLDAAPDMGLLCEILAIDAVQGAWALHLPELNA